MLATLTGAALPDPIADEPTAPAAAADADKGDQALKSADKPADGDQPAAGAEVPPSHVKTPDESDKAGAKTPAAPVAKDAQNTDAPSTDAQGASTVSTEKPSAAKR